MIAAKDENDTKIEMLPIGYVENDLLKTGYNEKARQTVSRIVLKEEFTKGLYRIEDFEKLQVLFHFSKAAGYELVQRRRYDGEISGVFACRSPHRPNGIGLTTVEFLKVEGNVLHVKGLDAINGTPVLDIKPYIEKIDEAENKKEV